MAVNRYPALSKFHASARLLFTDHVEPEQCFEETDEVLNYDAHEFGEEEMEEEEDDDMQGGSNETILIE